MGKKSRAKEWTTNPELRAKFEAFVQDERALDLYSPTGLHASGRKAWHLLAEEFQLSSMSVGEGLHRQVRVCKQAIAQSTTALNSTGMRRFREDFGLKINLADVRDFSYFLALYQKHYAAQDKLALMRGAMEELGGEQAWKNYLEVPKQKIWEAVQSQPAWSRLDRDDMATYQSQIDAALSRRGMVVHRGDPFVLDNDGRFFISFDLRSANFNSLHHYDPSLTLGHTSWEDFLGDFVAVQSRYFQQSKLFRQKVFWKLHPTRLMTIAGALISRVLDVLYALRRDDLVCAKGVAVYWNQDEVVLALPPEIQTLARAAAHIAKTWSMFPGHPELGSIAPLIRLEIYRLRALSLTRKMFVKEPLMLDIYQAEGRAVYAPLPTFVRVSPAHFAMVYKHYFGLPLDPRDCKLSWDTKNHCFTKTELAELALVPEVVASSLQVQ